MISSHDRSGWFGASDTSMIMGNWNTTTFAKWWLVKLGILQNNFSNIAMKTGTAYEHKILDFLEIPQRDRQIKIRKYRLRVNLDGESEIIHEVKTHSKEKFVVTKGYWQQAQIEMFATGKKLEIIAYQLLAEDYENFFNEIDGNRISRHPIEYDLEWVTSEYLPRLIYLRKCLKKGVTPKNGDVKRG